MPFGYEMRHCEQIRSVAGSKWRPMSGYLFYVDCKFLVTSQYEIGLPLEDGKYSSWLLTSWLQATIQLLQ